MALIPLAATPSQTVAVRLGDQSCQIAVYQKAPGLFLDLYVNDRLVVGGVICLNTALIVRDTYLGFAGDLAFFDLQGNTDPVYTGLGDRYVLAYVGAGQVQ